MRTQLLAFFILIALVGCGESPSNQGVIEVTVLAQNPHPYLIDHDRVCVITRDGEEVTRIDLYPDTGTGMSISNLYELPDTNQIVLIDKNGTWYFIDQTSGKLINHKWYWQEEPPAHFLGTFAYDQDQRAYELIDKADRDESNIYLVKDPNTQ